MHVCGRRRLSHFIQTLYTDAHFRTLALAPEPFVVLCPDW